MWGYDLADDGDVKSPFKSWVYDLKTGKRDERPVPKNFSPTAVSQDGKMAVLQENKHRQIHIATFDGKKPQSLFEPNFSLFNSPIFSPDGERVLMRVEERGVEEKEWKSDRLIVMELATNKITIIKDLQLGNAISGGIWSPNGKRVAYIDRKKGQGRGDDGLSICTVDANGQNAKEIVELVGTFGHIDDTGLTMAWSPDGKRLAYVHQTASPKKNSYSSRVVVIDADGTNPKEIYKADDASWVLMGFDWK